MYNKKITYSYEQYEGHNNKEIILLINDLKNCKHEQYRIEKLIKQIQDNCEHEYMFVCKGAYDDNYTCRKCGHDICK